MRLVTLGAVGGLLAGLVPGGRLAHLGHQRVRARPLLGAGLALLAVAGRAGAGWAGGLLVVAYGCLAAFAAANVALVGTAVVLVGLVANLAVAAANGAMPVRAEALAAAGLPAEGLRAGRRLEGPDDRWTVLGGVVPVRPLAEVVSIGDVVVAVGLGNVARHLVRPPRRRRAVAGR